MLVARVVRLLKNTKINIAPKGLGSLEVKDVLLNQ